MGRMVAICGAFAALGLGSTPGFAQATRTWVSGVGDDANPCSRTAPCKTFAGAITKTTAGGEINCLDSGGFGALTITKALSIICAGVEGGVLVSGTNGIVINAGVSDAVHLSGLDIEGLGSGISGIAIIQAGQVRIENSTIRGFTAGGIYVAPATASGGVRVDVLDTVVADNGSTGIRVKPGGGASVQLSAQRVTISQNAGDGLIANGTGSTGMIGVTMRDSASVNNVLSGMTAYSAGSNVAVVLDGVIASANNTGVVARGSGATLSFTRSTITGNATGVLQAAGGAAVSYDGNVIAGNTASGSFGTAPQQ